MARSCSRNNHNHPGWPGRGRIALPESGLRLSQWLVSLARVFVPFGMKSTLPRSLHPGGEQETCQSSIDAGG
jgi:hypothetical protein